jgi:hypothetical protein
VDYNAVGLEQARQAVLAEGQAARVALADVADPPFADGAFDIVLAWGVLFHTTPDRAVTMLRQVRRMLKAGTCWPIGEATRTTCSAAASAWTSGRT